MDQPPKPVILDMDNGCGTPMADVDDGLALALALASPELRIAACTACAGNCRAHESARNTLHMLHIANRRDIPTGLGPETPLLRDRSSHFAYLDAKRHAPEGRYWRQDSPPGTAFRLSELPPAPELMADCVRAEPGGVTLVCTGSLTNAALFIKEHPEEASRLREIVHMGGAFPPEPGETEWEASTPDIPATAWRDTLRFNPLFDPEASAIVFASGIPVTVVPANVTMRTFLRPRHLEALRDAPAPLARHLHETCTPWLRWSMEVRGLPGAHMHDPLALALTFAPGLCRFETMHVDVKTLLKPDATFLKRGDTAPSVNVAVTVDSEQAEALLAQRLRSLAS